MEPLQNFERRVEQLDERMSQYIKERNAALLSLDETVIRALVDKWGLRFPGDNDPIVFWGAIHKARTAIASIPEAERQKSIAWLRAHGMTDWSDGIKID
jgi:hypothetical protein